MGPAKVRDLSGAGKRIEVPRYSNKGPEPGFNTALWVVVFDVWPLNVTVSHQIAGFSQPRQTSNR